jgi:competence protein ComEA
MRSLPDRNQYILLAAVALLFLGSLFVLQLLDDDPAPLEFTQGDSLPDGAPIRVHVAGAVVRPGVYDLRAGDRVIEALAAAGGPSATADVETVNLARRLRDAEQLVVPQRRTPSTAAATLPPGARLDINAATEAELDLLPGIGEAYSRRIIDSRRVDGPFKSTDELVQRRVLPQATFERVRDLISVGP